MEKLENSKKLIIFYESFPTEMVAKLARELRLNNYATILLYCNEGSADGNTFLKEAYSKIIPLNDSKTRGLKTIRDVAKLIKKLNPRAVFYRSNPELLGAILFILLRKKYPFIYFPYDIISVVPADKSSFKNKLKYKLEAYSQKFCLSKADGIIHKGDINEFNYLDKSVFKKSFKIKAPVLHMPPYCSDEFLVKMNSKKKISKEPNLVFIGSVNDNAFFASRLASIPNSKVHLHVYTKSINKGQNTVYESFKNSNNFSELIKNKYFHLHKSLGSKDIVKEIAKYDYGLLLDYSPAPKGDIGLATSTCNKFSSYLEAGIPSIYIEGLKYQGVLVKKYGVGFGFSPDIADWKPLLKTADYKKLLKNVEKARKEFTFKNNLAEFEYFLEKAKKHNENS